METISIQEKKKALRKEIKSRKANYSKEELKAISKPIIDKLLEDELIKNAHLIMAYFFTRSASASRQRGFTPCCYL